MVDDEEDLLETTGCILENLGYDLFPMANSVQALERFRSDPKRFDLVITDQTMPGLTGLELSKAILSLVPDVPVILCTGFSHAVTPEAIREAGIREVLMKPITMRAWADSIRRALKRSI